MRRLLPALLLATFAARAAAGSTLSAAEPEGSPARRLVGGTMATLSREGPAAGSPGQEWREWEAFLSLDGGATFPIRLTPHLDLEVRSVRFRVPDYPTRDGRLLLRYGDETVETAFHLPHRITIEKGAAPPLPARIALNLGEPARPGEPGVLLWTEGDPLGGRQQTYAAGVVSTTMRGVSAAPARRRPQARGPRTSRYEPARPASARVLRGDDSGPEPAALLPPSPSPEPIRIRIGRWNE